MSKARRLCDVCRKEIRDGEDFVCEQRNAIVYGRIGAPSSGPSGVAKGRIAYTHATCPEAL